MQKPTTTGGVIRKNLGDFKGAIADFTKAIELKPDYAEAYNNRGVTRDDLEDYQGAIADYTKAIELKPDLAEAYGNRGFLYARMGEKQKAIEDVEKAAKIFCEQGSPNCQKAQDILKNLQQ